MPQHHSLSVVNAVDRGMGLALDSLWGGFVPLEFATIWGSKVLALMI